jgi:preprotein translocase subunit SecA
MVDGVVKAYVSGASAEGHAKDWDLDRLWNALRQRYPDAKARKD